MRTPGMESKRSRSPGRRGMHRYSHMTATTSITLDLNSRAGMLAFADYLEAINADPLAPKATRIFGPYKIHPYGMAEMPARVRKAATLAGRKRKSVWQTPKPPAPTLDNRWRAEAVAFYGTEVAALKNLRRTLEIQRDYMEESAVKRTEKAISFLAAGHHVYPTEWSESRWEERGWVKITVKGFAVMGKDSQKILGRVIQRKAERITAEEFERIKAAGFIINL